ncbi:MAG: RNA polymerase sigma factor YlaC [Parcubacteria group bacterium ADurb.Bin216]|nr:MAG: RNA polymerase sigma factor YlaC [Parcubacteria group bacterium ADurb.Bin216]
MNNEELKQLVVRIKDKDSQAFTELFDFYYPKIFSYAIRSTIDTEQAKDITSNTFVKVLDNIKKFQWQDNHSFNGWIYRIATNEINQFFRKQSRYKLVIDEGEYILSDDNQAVQEIEERIRRDEDLHIINKALSQMSEDFSSIIRLRYIEELPYEEIAQAMGKNESTVRVYAKRAKEKLREIISKEQPWKN